MDSPNSASAALARVHEPAENGGLTPAAPSIFALLRQARAQGRDGHSRPDPTCEAPR